MMHSATSDPQTIALPALRQDLNLIMGEPLENGEESWLVHDRVKNSFYRLDTKALHILRNWSQGQPDKIIALASQQSGHAISFENFQETLQFLLANSLTCNSMEDKSSVFADQEAAATPPFWKKLIHNYLFFKIPLFHPYKFLNLTAPLVKPLFWKQTWIVFAVLSLIGLYLVSKQWDVFTQTFLHFLSFEGALFYGVTLIFMTLVHELGHAYTTHHYKCRVSTIGLAFIVMFPILYTDTTDAWRLKNKHHRLAIDIAGIASELLIACIATLAWSFLPDGMLRSAAFFLATTSWTLSLLINLNPFMRFDGYYIFSDFLGIENLQQKSFALGRWRMREFLFGLGDRPPYDYERGKSIGLSFFAWGTWIYRFFLFLGIALFIHAFFHKALGIILFMIEIAWFIGKPIMNELAHWYSIRAHIFQNHKDGNRGSIRGRISVIALGVFIIALFVPWQSHIRAPAILTPKIASDLYPRYPGMITVMNVSEGQTVKQGDLLFRVRLPDIENSIQLTKITIAQLQSQLNRTVSDRDDRAQISVLNQSLQTEIKRLSGYQSLLKEADIVAPHDGVISNLQNQLAEGQWVNSVGRLASIINLEKSEIIIMATETQRSRLVIGRTLNFIPDDIQSHKQSGAIKQITNVAQEDIQNPVFSSLYGGPVAIEEDDTGRHIPTQSIFSVYAEPKKDEQSYRTLPGVAIIAAERQAPITAIWRQISAVLVREIDF